MLDELPSRLPSTGTELQGYETGIPLGYILDDKRYIYNYYDIRVDY